MKKIQRSFIIAVSKVLILIGLALAGGWGWKYVAHQRVVLYQAQQAMIDLPERLNQETAVRTELERRGHDLNRLYTYTPTREGISEVVTYLEQEARRKKIQLSITDIAEEQSIDENGKPVPLTGPLIEVHINGMAGGRPEDLISFLFSMEHMPYLSRVAEFRLDALSIPVTTGVSARIPVSIDQLKTDTPLPASGQLFFTLLVSVRYE